jgi:hypothetical protein
MFRKAILAIIVAATVLVIAVAADKLCRFLPLHLQFVVQVPIIILMIDALRNYVLAISTLGLTDSEINACFFMASPMVSIGSVSLGLGIKALL